MRIDRWLHMPAALHVNCMWIWLGYDKKKRTFWADSIRLMRGFRGLFVYSLPSASRTSRSFCSLWSVCSSVSKDTGSGMDAEPGATWPSPSGMKSPLIKSLKLTSSQVPRVESKYCVCPVRSCSVGSHLHCSLTASSSCNSSTPMTDSRISALRPLLQYQVHSRRLSWEQLVEILPTSIADQSWWGFG